MPGPRVLGIVLRLRLEQVSDFQYMISVDFDPRFQLKQRFSWAPAPITALTEFEWIFVS